MGQELFWIYPCPWQLGTGAVDGGVRKYAAEYGEGGGGQFANSKHMCVEDSYLIQGLKI